MAWWGATRVHKGRVFFFITVIHELTLRCHRRQCGRRVGTRIGRWFGRAIQVQLFGDEQCSRARPCRCLLLGRHRARHRIE